jgi:hypothetical protein
MICFRILMTSLAALVALLIVRLAFMVLGVDVSLWADNALDYACVALAVVFGLTFCWYLLAAAWRGK